MAAGKMKMPEIPTGLIATLIGGIGATAGVAYLGYNSIFNGACVGASRAKWLDQRPRGPAGRLTWRRGVFARPTACITVGVFMCRGAQ